MATSIKKIQWERTDTGHSSSLGHITPIENGKGYNFSLLGSQVFPTIKAAREAAERRFAVSIPIQVDVRKKSKYKKVSIPKVQVSAPIEWTPSFGKTKKFGVVSPLGEISLVTAKNDLVHGIPESGHGYYFYTPGRDFFIAWKRPQSDAGPFKTLEEAKKAVEKKFSVMI